MKRAHAWPLVITTFRLMLGPVFWLLLVRPGDTSARLPFLLAIVVLAIVTDWLDGFLARRMNAVSSVGKLLDPFADALFCMIVFLAFAQRGLMPWWIVIVLMCREGVVTFIVRSLAFSRGLVISARLPGKLKTSFQFGVMLTVLVALVPGVPFVSALRLLAQVGFYIVLALSLTSAGAYGVEVMSTLSRERLKCKLKDPRREVAEEVG